MYELGIFFVRTFTFKFSANNYLKWISVALMKDFTAKQWQTMRRRHLKKYALQQKYMTLDINTFIQRRLRLVGKLQNDSIVLLD